MDKIDYSVLGYGKPWKQQYHINDTQDGDITGWTKSGNLPIALGYSQAVITKNRLYILVGCNNNIGDISDIYSAPISGGLNDYTSFS